MGRGSKKNTSKNAVVLFAVAKQSDFIPVDGERGPISIVKPKLVVGRNAIVIYCLVSTANGHKDTLGSSEVHCLMERNGCQLVLKTAVCCQPS